MGVTRTNGIPGPPGNDNSSGQVGRNDMRHMTGSVYGVLDEPVHMYRGPPWPA